MMLRQADIIDVFFLAALEGVASIAASAIVQAPAGASAALRGGILEDGEQQPFHRIVDASRASLSAPNTASRGTSGRGAGPSEPTAAALRGAARTFFDKRSAEMASPGDLRA